MQKRNAKDLLAKPRIFILVACIPMIVGFYLRVEPALFDITHFSFDQGLDQILVKDLVVDKDISLISRYSGLEGVFMGPLFTWLMVPPFFLSGDDPNANVVYFALLSMISAVGTYFFVDKMLGRAAAVFAGIITLLGTPFIGASKVVISPTPILFLMIGYIYLLWAVCFTKRARVVPGLFFLISLFFQFEIGYAVFVLLSTLVILTKYNKQLWRRFFLVTLSGVSFVIPFIPQILFDMRHNFLITRAVIGFITGENDSLGSQKLSLFGHVWSRMGMFVEDFFSATAFGHENMLLGIVAFGLIMYGQHLIRKEGDSQKFQLSQMLTLFIFLMYLGFFLFPGNVWPWYRVGMPAVFSLLFVVSITKVWESSFKTRPLIYMLLSVLVFISIDPISRLEIIKGDYPGTVSTNSFQKMVLDSIYTDSNNQPFSLYVYTEPVYPWIWDYQLWSYGRNTYGYLPSPYDRMPQPDNPENVYLLIEPHQYESWMVGWRDNFTHFGEVEKSWTNPGGVVVEKWKLESQPEGLAPLVKYTDVFAGE